MPTPYYVVHRGRRPGIYRNWNECKVQVEKFDGAQFKKFDNEFEAQQFLEKGFGTKVVESKSQKIKKAIENKNERFMTEAMNSEEDKIYIYTDGSLIRQGSNVYSGYGYFIPLKNIRVSKPLKNQKITNNRAELTAIIESVECLSEEDRQKQLCIFTDSQYSIYLFTGTGERYERNGWKNDKKEEVPNPDLIQKLLELKRRYNIHLLKVKAHTDAQDEHSLGNSTADRLANDAALSMKNGGREENPFRQRMFGEKYSESEYERMIQEEVEEKTKKIKKMDNVEITADRLFDGYDETYKNANRERKVGEVKKVEKKLRNTNLKSWFLEDE